MSPLQPSTEPHITSDADQSDQLRVGIDVSALDPDFKEHSARGIGRYVRNLIHGLERINASSAASVDVSVGTFDHGSFILPNIIERAINLAPLGRQTIRQQLCYPLQLNGPRLKHFDVVHFTAHMDAPSWSRKPYILTILDLIPIVCADLYKVNVPSWRFRLARWLELRAMYGAALVIAISEQTSRDVQKYLGIPGERIFVTPLGVEERFFQRPSLEMMAEACHQIEVGLKEPFAPLRKALAGQQTSNRNGNDPPLLLYVGGIDQRKNMGGLLKIFSRTVEARREQGKSAPHLLIVGRNQEHRDYPQLLATVAALGLQDLVQFPGYLADQYLTCLYRLCDVFVFPSLYEGFGLPPLEAMAAGLPVVAADTSSVPEVVGDSGLLYPPTDECAGAEAILTMLNQPELARNLRQRGQARARLFSWDKTAQLTMGVYEQMQRRLKAPLR